MFLLSMFTGLVYGLPMRAHARRRGHDGRTFAFPFVPAIATAWPLAFLCWGVSPLSALGVLAAELAAFGVAYLRGRRSAAPTPAGQLTLDI